VKVPDRITGHSEYCVAIAKQLFLDDLQRDLQLHWAFSLPNNILLEDLIRAKKDPPPFLMRDFVTNY
jgi:hypothetical protein